MQAGGAGRVLLQVLVLLQILVLLGMSPGILPRSWGAAECKGQSAEMPREEMSMTGRGLGQGGECGEATQWPLGELEVGGNGSGEQQRGCSPPASCSGAFLPLWLQVLHCSLQLVGGGAASSGEHMGLPEVWVPCACQEPSGLGPSAGKAGPGWAGNSSLLFFSRRRVNLKGTDREGKLC